MWRELVDADSGAGGDPALSSVPSSLSAVQMRDAEPLRVPVPPGTFVRTKGGRVLGDLVAPGQEICVATGGSGGPCVLGKERSTGGKGGGRGGGKSSRRGKRRVDEDGLGGGSNMEDAFELNESELHALTRGSSPTEVKLSLVMRTVADVGFVGFPNAGKSTLLKALSRASPEIAPFPFTTLMPNLGAMALDETDQAEGGRPFSKAAPTVLADLPGLVEGAHEGKGLGRLFLRHLRRVRVVLYVLDTSCEEPSIEDQYDALRNELRLYNPHYLERPHVVVLSKLDLPLDAGGEEALAEARRAGTRAVSASATRALEHTAAPVEIVPVSGLKGKGLRILKQAIEKALDVSRELEGGAGGKNQPS
jgi:Obg family GTPase CgtA